MTDFAHQYSIPTSNEDWAYHRQNMEKAIESGQESDWHDFKQGIFSDKEADNLCKDIVALANTVGGPYQGFGYIILGVRDDGKVTGLQGKDVVTEDERQLRIKNKIQSNIEPYIDVQIKEFKYQEQCIHLLIIPQSRLHWHFIRSTQNTSHLYGHWIRRGRASERPLLDDYAQHTAQAVEHKTKSIKEELAGVKQQLIEVRQTIADMKSQTSPESLTPIEFVRTAFTTPGRTLLRQARRIISEYQSKSETRVALFENLSVDQFVQDADSRTPERKQIFKEYFEMVESDVRPSVELVAHIMHEAPEENLVREAVKEITYSVERSSIYYGSSSNICSAVSSYQMQLYLYGITLSAYYATELHFFHDILSCNKESLNVMGRVQKSPLVFCLKWNTELNNVMSQIYPEESLHTLSSRFEYLLLQPAWVGETMPVCDGGTRFLNSEALLSFGFVYALVRRAYNRPAIIDFNWWKHKDANQILVRALEIWKGRGQLIFSKRSTVEAADFFDNMDKMGSRLTIEAIRILTKR